MWLWVRIGDADNYHSAKNIPAVAARLRRNRIRQATPNNIYGVESAEFQNNNYISLYWGDRDAQPTRGLTAAELEELNERLSCVPR